MKDLYRAEEIARNRNLSAQKRAEGEQLLREAADKVIESFKNQGVDIIIPWNQISRTFAGSDSRARALQDAGIRKGCRVRFLDDNELVVAEDRKTYVGCTRCPEKVDSKGYLRVGSTGCPCEAFVRSVFER